MLQVMLARTPHLPSPEIDAWLPHGFMPPQLTRSRHTSDGRSDDDPAAEGSNLPLPPLDAPQVVYWRSDYF